MDNQPKTKEEIKQELKKLLHDFSFLQSLKNIDDVKRNQLKKELAVALKEIASQNKKAEKLAAELIITNLNIKFENKEKEKRAAALVIANIELAFQNREKAKRAAALIIANKELAFQNEEKEKRADELIIANKELIFQNEEKEKRAAVLVIANKEFAFQNKEKAKRAAALVIANKELAFQNEEKEKRAAELVIANKELALLNSQIEKRSIDALKEKENRFRAYVEQASDSLFVHDFSGKFIDVNKRACETLGYSKEELLDMSVFDVDMDFDLEKAQKDWKQIENNQHFMLLGHQRRKDGSIFPVEVNIGCFNMNDKCYFLAQARDITERKQAEEKLLENYALLHIAGDIAKLGGWSINLKENVVIWSNEVAAIHEMPAGYAPLVEEGINFYAPEWHDKITEVFTNCVQKGISYDEDMEILTASGKRVCVRTIGEAVRDNKGKIVKVQGAFQDITERKQIVKKLQQNEEKYRFMFANNPQPMWIYDLETLAFLEINNASISLYGYSREEFLSMTLKDIRPKEDLDALFKNINQTTKAHSFSGEWRHLKKNGEIITIEITSHIITFNNRKARHVMANDVTERKQAEESLLKSKQEYQSFFEDDLTGDYISTVEGKLLNCNPAYLKILGFSSKEEALNYDMRKVYVNEGGRDELIQKLKENKTITNLEGDIKRVDGTIINVVANINGGFDSEGNLITLKGYIFDQTERKKATDQLRKLSVAVEQSPATVLMTDIKGNIEYVNKKFTEVTGYLPEEVIGKNPRIFKSGHQSKDVYEHLWQNITSGKEWFGELLNKKKDGSLYWEQASISPIKNDKGKITHFLGLKEDISEKKRAEQVQNIILNISNASQTEMGLKELMKVIQKELGRIVDAKNFFVALYNEVNDTLHIPYYQDENDDVVDFPAKKTITGLVIKKGKSLLLSEADCTILEEKGEIEMVGESSKIWLGVPLKIKGKTTGVFVIQSYEDENAYSENDKAILEIVSQQISISIERKRHEEELLKALEKAKESDRLKSAFIANMSHEIRTPMNGILGFSALLKSADLNSEKQQKYIKIIEKSGARLLTTIDDIMNISKIEAGLAKISLSEININNEIEELYAFFKLETENKGLQLLVVNSLQEDGSIVKTDKVKLHSILVNLIKNAIKYTKQGRVEFGCSKKGNQLEFYVKDTGIGIPLDRQPYVFDRFVQADIEDKAVFEGSGLGLAISKSYVDMLGGIIELESVEGIGSTFSFTIPCQAINKEIPVAKNELSNDFVELEISSLKILIVEDDVIAQLYLEELLTDVSKEILLADNGYKALDLCRENSDIDLILMDIRMPGINGYEVTKQIRQFNKEVIIIAQTAFALSGDREKALEAGCNDYISKPINKDYLVALTQKYFKKK